MTKLAQWLLRGLAVGHLAWGLLLILVAAYTAYSALAVLAYMSTGTVWSNLPIAMVLALEHSVPCGLLGGWMLILGRRIWSGTRPVRTALLVTHGISLMIGSLSVVVGVYAVRGAEISTARGGGLLSPLAWVPLIFGIVVVTLALPSIILALTSIPETADSRKAVEP